MKRKIIIIGIIIVIFIVIILIVGKMTFKNIILELSGNVSLDTENYLTAVEVNSNAEFILLFNKNKKVSNIIYLNDNSVKSLYEKKIEGKTIEEAMKIIIENLSRNDIFDDNKNIILVDYGNTEIFSKVLEEINKEFVIYGINKTITNDYSKIEEKLLDLNLNRKNNIKKDLKTLYYHSLDIINEYKKIDNDGTSNNINEEKMAEYAMNIYNKLLIYSKNIINQSKDDLSGIDITTINATKDYKNDLYVTKNSWYYIQDNKVYAYINFNYNNNNYDYCFNGNNSYINGQC